MMKLTDKKQIFATGFNITQLSFKLQGRGGEKLESHWGKSGYRQAYKSIAMHNFPNFFQIIGPNSVRLYSSTIFSIER